MSTASAIEWTDTTWNPVTGCDKVSPGCKNCYAERMARRLHAMGQPRYANGFKVTLHEQSLLEPSTWKRSRKVFVNSMSDLFHESVPLDFIKRVFDVMTNHPQHTFQVLTKRSARLSSLAPELPWPSNVWMGVSVESNGYYSRIHDLMRVPAHVRFLSCEPLLSELPDLPLSGVHWVIVGGESGPRSRPMAQSWVSGILEQCRQHDVPFFFKQWGGTRKKKTGRELYGATYDEYPNP